MGMSRAGPLVIRHQLPTSGAGARVARGSAAYAGAAVAQRAVGLVLLPLYARVLGPTAYGQLAIIITIAAALTTVLSFGLETALFRTYVRLRDQPREQSQFVNAVGLFLLVVPTASVGLLLLVALHPISSFFRVDPLPMAVGMASVALSVSATVLPMVLLRADERLTAYLVLSAATVVTNTALMVGLVVIGGMGVVGWLLASAGAAGVQLLIGLALLGHRWSLTVDWRHLGAALAFGLPLVPHAFSHWALTLSDRAVLGAFVSQAQIGVYNFGYQLGLPLSVLTIALHQGIMPIYAQASMDERHRRDLGPLVTQQVLVTLLLGFGAAALGPPIVLAIMPSSFSAAAEVLPWIVLGYTFFGLYLIPMDAVSVMAGKTRWAWVATSVAAALNVALNLLFVPRYGIMASAVSTAVSYAALLLGICIYLVRVQSHPIPYEWRRMGYGAAAALIACAILFLPTGPLLVSLVVRVLVCLALLGVFLSIGFRTHRSGGSTNPRPEGG